MTASPTAGSGPQTVYITTGMVEALLELASANDPDPVSTGISTVPADELDGDGVESLDPAQSVFAEYLLPDPGNSLTHVFGVELSTPNRSTQGRFVSHPDGVLDVTLRDDLGAVVLVAVPPWEADDASLRAFDRAGDQLSLQLLDAEPPEQPFED